ncbi:MAG: chemotaxis protein CheW [Panacagrimonas sp.]
MSHALRDLRGDPFALLLELDAHLRRRLGGRQRPADDAWQGLAVRIARQWLLVPQADVREVLAPPRCTRVPNAQPWLAGVGKVRGRLLTVVDAGRRSGASASAASAGARALLLRSDRSPLLFLVDEIAGHQAFGAAEQASVVQPVGGIPAACLLGAFCRDGRQWPVLSLHRWAQSEALRSAGA